MIDQDKMRALVAKLRGPLAKFDNFAAGYSEAADAIDLLLAELEAAAADKRDAERWRKLKSELHAQGRFGVYNDGWLDEQSLETKIDVALAQRQGEGS
ncbi:hypothetical protein [Burkholderia cenocepacia]|uniref:hypothetical protein n=1 Tax=Burkholderia cenocepacia TaxID=95486 RepID=UPI001F4AA748|nr:hypothetical protein [Burkholderia cenocepacia]